MNVTDLSVLAAKLDALLQFYTPEDDEGKPQFDRLNRNEFEKDAAELGLKLQHTNDEWTEMLLSPAVGSSGFVFLPHYIRRLNTDSVILVEVLNDNYGAALQVAVDSKNVEIVKAILNRMPEPVDEPIRFNHHARNKFGEILALLLQSPMVVKIGETYDWMNSIVAEGKTELVRMAILHDVYSRLDNNSQRIYRTSSNSNVRTRYTKDLLDIAIEFGRLEIAVILLDSITEPLGDSYVSASTPIFESAVYYHDYILYDDVAYFIEDELSGIDDLYTINMQLARCVTVRNIASMTRILNDDRFEQVPTCKDLLIEARDSIPILNELFKSSKLSFHRAQIQNALTRLLTYQEDYTRAIQLLKTHLPLHPIRPVTYTEPVRGLKPKSKRSQRRHVS